MKDPQIDAIITESQTVIGEYSVKGITAQGQRTLKLLLKDAGFVPGDIVTIRLKDDDSSIHSD